LEATPTPFGCLPENRENKVWCFLLFTAL
jgi:hypothetical protein